MRTVIFTGPTLSASEAAGILDAEYLPPVSQGDLIGLVHGERPDVVGIIDGTLGEEPSVWHKEILDALDRNVVIFGAGAVGALRAAECDRFGMKGVGRVYKWLKEQSVSRDDEVLCAVERANGKFIRTSEPLCNIRATLRRAFENGLADEEALDVLLDIAASTFYRRRTFPDLFRVAAGRGLPGETIEALASFAKSSYVDVQRDDAVEMLETIKRADLRSLREEQRPIRCGTRGHLYRALYNRDRRVAAGSASFRIPLYLVGNTAMLNHPDFPAFQRRAFNRSLVTLLADILKVYADDEAVEKEAERFRRKHGLRGDDEFEAWLRENDISKDEFTETMRQEARITRLHRWLVASRGLEKGTGIILDELRRNDEYRGWKRKAAEDERDLAGREGEIAGALKAQSAKQLLNDFLADRKGIDPVAFIESALAVGFDMTTLRYELAGKNVLRRDLDGRAYDLLFREQDEHARED